MSEALGEGGESVDEDRFWQIVDATVPAAADRQRQFGLLLDQLRGLPPEQVAAFGWCFRRQVERSNCSNVKGAWRLIDGQGADDAFREFRCWLVSRGRALFEAALTDPDTLAWVVEPGEDTHFGEFDSSNAVYHQMTGRECPPDPAPPEPSPGEAWNADDRQEVRRRMPRLARLFEVPKWRRLLRVAWWLLDHALGIPFGLFNGLVGVFTLWLIGKGVQHVCGRGAVGVVRSAAGWFALFCGLALIGLTIAGVVRVWTGKWPDKDKEKSQQSMGMAWQIVLGLIVALMVSSFLAVAAEGFQQFIEISQAHDRTYPGFNRDLAAGSPNKVTNLTHWRGSRSRVELTGGERR
jgi:hypothetical protein